MSKAVIVECSGAVETLGEQLKKAVDEYLTQGTTDTPIVNVMGVAGGEYLVSVFDIDSISQATDFSEAAEKFGA